MKIAVQLYGHLRTFERCYKRLFECLVNLYQCDVFIHTWDKLDHTTETWHSYRIKSDITSEQIKERIVECYHPKKYLVERQEVRDEGGIVAQHKYISAFGIKAMIHSMLEVNKLREEYEKETNSVYDYVVMLRPDVELWLPFDIVPYLDDTTAQDVQNSFYFGGFYKYKHILNDWRSIGGGDVLFFAPRRAMAKIFGNVERLERNCTNQEIACYGPEYAFLYTVEKLDIKLQFINYLWGEKYTVIRQDMLPEGNDQSENPPKTRKIKKWYKRLVRIHIRKYKLDFGILAMLPFNIAEVEIHVQSWFTIYLCLGKMAN